MVWKSLVEKNREIFKKQSKEYLLENNDDY